MAYIEVVGVGAKEHRALQVNEVPMRLDFRHAAKSGRHQK